MSRRRSDPGEEYEVGYAKPPAQHRFKPGQSGNPKGGPRGARGVATLVNEALDETIQVSTGGRPREMKKREALLAAMIAKAIKGDVRAASLVVKLMETHDPEPARDGEPTFMRYEESPSEKIERMLAGLRRAQGIPDDDDGNHDTGHSDDPETP
jgi:hypothetical protein